MKRQIRKTSAAGHRFYFVLNQANPNNVPCAAAQGENMSDTNIKLIVDLLQELRKNGVRYEELAAGLFVCTKTIRNYSKGQIPNSKIRHVLKFVKSNYQEIYSYVCEKRKQSGGI